jgi:2-iminobutanoate/2-iminopropanoate deaminase
MKKKLVTKNAPEALGPYSQAIEVCNGLVFVSGQIPLCPQTGVMESDVKKATRLVINNIRRILEAGGLGLKDVVKSTVFLADLSTFSDMNEVYEEMFADAKPFPARSTIEVSKLPKYAVVEIECIAKRQ